MPAFSKQSRDKLETCHIDLQILFNYVVVHFDCTVVSGQRTPEEQQRLFAKGRTEPGEIVTYKDGVDKLSKHNYNPSYAVDVVPYFAESPHIRWDDIDSFSRFGMYVLDIAKMLKSEGTIDSVIEWGGKWKFKDYPHFQIQT